MKSFEVRQLRCVRGDRPLFEGLSFRLESGGLIHLKGANGAGKTSLLRILCGLASADAGELFADDAPLGGQRDRVRAATLYVGHHNALQDALTVDENLRFHAALHGHAQGSEAVRAALDALSLRACQHRLARVLSQGQRRRASLARLFLCAAPLWILDEPFVALDQASVARLSQAIGAHVKAGGMVVLTSHQDVAIDGVRTQALDLDAFVARRGQRGQA